MLVVVGLAVFCTPFVDSLGDRYLVTYLFPAFALLGAPVAWFFLLPFRFATADVGEEGVFVRYRTRPSRFFPFAEIDSATAVNRSVRVHAAGKSAFVLEGCYAPMAIANEIENGVRAARNLRDLSSALSSSTPKELGRASLGQGANYRIAAPTRDELWEVVEAGAARGAARVSAAEVIASTLVEGELARLGAVAERCLDRSTRRRIEDLIDRAAADRMVEEAARGMRRKD
jgi:hypothetical protein